MYLILQQLTAEMISQPFLTADMDVMVKIWILTLTRVMSFLYINSPEFISTQKFKKACEPFYKGKSPFLLNNKKR